MRYAIPEAGLFACQMRIGDDFCAQTRMLEFERAIFEEKKMHTDTVHGWDTIPPTPR